MLTSNARCHTTNLKRINWLWTSSLSISGEGRVPPWSPTDWQNGSAFIHCIHWWLGIALNDRTEAHVIFHIFICLMNKKKRPSNSYKNWLFTFESKERKMRRQKKRKRCLTSYIYTIHHIFSVWQVLSFFLESFRSYLCRLCSWLLSVRWLIASNIHSESIFDRGRYRVEKKIM